MSTALVPAPTPTRFRLRPSTPAKTSTPQIAILWEQYVTGCTIARDKLLEHHLGLVHHIARQMVRSLGTHADLSDLISSGTNGLMVALQRFDHSRGLSFSTFAAPRIRGSILDDLRKGDNVSRLARQRGRTITNAWDTLQAALHRSPTEAEVARYIGIPVATLWRWKSDFENNKLVSLDRRTQEDSQNNSLHNSLVPLSDLDTLPDNRSSNIEDDLNDELQVRFLREAIQEMKDQERIVLSLYYFEDLPSAQIATVLGVSESRISQIRARALEQLREKVGAIRSYMV